MPYDLKEPRPTKYAKSFCKPFRYKTTAQNTILTINAGSSKLKFVFYNIGLSAIAAGNIQGIGRAPEFSLASGKTDHPPSRFAVSDTHEIIAEKLLFWLDDAFCDFTIKDVGHRLVHGWRDFSGAVKLDAKLDRSAEGFDVAGTVTSVA